MKSSETFREGSPSFEPTRWSLIIRASAMDEAERGKALDDLCRTYWYPVYAFLRRSGRGIEDAEDLTQDFFARLLGSDFLKNADPTRGKFRNLMLTAVKNLDTDAYRATRSLKRGGGADTIPLDAKLAESRWMADTSPSSSPEHSFDRAWAVVLMAQAGERIREEYGSPEQAALLAELSPRLIGSGNDGLADVATRLGKSEAAVKMSLSRLRRRFADALRTEISKTVAGREEVQSELLYLLSAYL